MLARHFLREYEQRFGAGPFSVDHALRDKLAPYRWPGNVRELSNAIESLVALSPVDALDLTLLPSDAPASAPSPSATLEERVAAYERGVLLAAIESAQGNRTEAAKALGIGRATLYEKLRKHGI